MKGVKGFGYNITSTGYNLTCRGYKFMPEQSYTHDGDIKMCLNGFHFVPDSVSPLAVLFFYAPFGGLRYFRVEASDEIYSNHIKAVAKTIHISDQELSFNDLVDLECSNVYINPTNVARQKYAITTSLYESITSGSSVISLTKEKNGLAVSSGPYSYSIVRGSNSTAIARGPGSYAIAMSASSTAISMNKSGCVVGTVPGVILISKGEGPNEFATGIVGKDGIKPNELYRCIDGKLRYVGYDVETV